MCTTKRLRYRWNTSLTETFVNNLNSTTSNLLLEEFQVELLNNNINQSVDILTSIFQSAAECMQP